MLCLLLLLVVVITIPLLVLVLWWCIYNRRLIVVMVVTTLAVHGRSTRTGTGTRVCRVSVIRTTSTLGVVLGCRTYNLLLVVLLQNIK